MKIYWGDLHNHCGISYGYGGLENALSAAKEQLDFCSIIGHASWHDIPEPTPELEYLVGFHKEGFQKLQDEWESIREIVKKANVPHEFVTFQGYEAHSSKFGDYHFISPNDELPLVYGNSPIDIINKMSNKHVIAVPHHVGYTPGYRGANWDEFNEKISPIVEVYSKHGCGMSDQSQYPYYHDMGPRDSNSTIFSGILKGHRFGFVGSTDHHAGYPGSYGDGRVAVLAKEKNRESIWEALLSRRTYAVTGDKIACSFKINGSEMGSEVSGTSGRNIELAVTSSDVIDKMVIYKNLKPWRIINGENLQPEAKNQTFKVRVEMGWGTSETGFLWNGDIKIANGNLLSVETCFRGRSVLAPSPNIQDNDSLNALNNKLIYQSDKGAAWTCTTFKNPTTLHSHTAAMVFEVQGEDAVITLTLNNVEKKISLKELMNGSVSKHLKSYNSEAFKIHRVIPEGKYKFNGQWVDKLKELNTDVYHAEIRQVNNQFAWISPIYVLS